MAISASSGSVNRILISVGPKSVFENALAVLSTSVTFNQGDLICLDETNHVLKAVAATGDAATILGIADVAVSSGKAVGPYDGLTAVNAAQALAPVKGPVYGVVATMKLKSGDAFVPGGKCYLADGQDCQTVSSVDPGDGLYIGRFQGAAVTASSGSQGPVLLIQRAVVGA